MQELRFVKLLNKKKNEKHYQIPIINIFHKDVKKN